METLTVKVVKPGVTFQGSELEVGEEFETEKASAEALAAEGFVEIPGAAEAGDQETEGGDETDPEAEKVKIAKALDAQYNKDELIEAAQKAGVDFPYDAKKAEIVQAVIEQEKAEALLK